MPKKGHTTSGWLKEHERLALYMRQDFRCAYCRRDVRGLKRDQVTLDHLIPGAGDGYHNLVLACKKCNCSKGNRRYDDYCRQSFTASMAEKLVAYIHRIIEAAVDVEGAKMVLHRNNGRWPV